MRRLDRGQAWLSCDHCNTWTRHRFVGELPTEDPLFVAERYRCTECGAARIWGLGYRPDEYAKIEAKLNKPAKREKSALLIARIRDSATGKPSDVLSPVEG